MPLIVFLVMLGYSFQVINLNRRDLRTCRTACEGRRGVGIDRKPMHQRGGENGLLKLYIQLAVPNQAGVTMSHRCGWEIRRGAPSRGQVTIVDIVKSFPCLAARLCTQ